MTYTERWSQSSRPEVDHRLVTLYKNRPIFIKVDSSQVKVHVNQEWRQIGSDRVYFNIRHSDSIMVLKSDDTEHLMVIRADWEGFFHLWQLTDDYDWLHLTQTYPAGQGYKILRFPSVILGSFSLSRIPTA